MASPPTRTAFVGDNVVQVTIKGATPERLARIGYLDLVGHSDNQLDLMSGIRHGQRQKDRLEDAF
ncbi:hypothetical protein [Magnetospira thiophila]